MARIFLYKVNDKISVDNNVMLDNQFLNYLNQRPIREELNVDLTPNWIKNINQLTNEITIYLEGRNPLTEYNYMRIQDLGGTKPNIFLFFITGYEEIGRNQVKYFLRLDTLNTYRFSEAIFKVDYENSTGLVLREHKDRFISKSGSTAIAKPPHNFIEDFDFAQSEATRKKILNNSGRQRLVLRQYGGTPEQDILKSWPQYFWEVYNETPKTSIINKKMTYNLTHGWGIRTNNGGFGGSYGDSTFYFPTNPFDPIGNPNSNLIVINLNNPEYLYINIYKWDGRPSVLPEDTLLTGGFEFVTTGLRIKKIQGNDVVKFDTQTSTVKAAIYYDFFHIQPELNVFNASPQLFFDNISSNSFTSPTINEINYNDFQIAKVIELPYEFVDDTLNLLGWKIPINSNLKKLQFLESFNNLNYNWATSITSLRLNQLDPKLLHSQFQAKFLFFNDAILDYRYEKLETQTFVSDNILIDLDINDSDYTKAFISFNPSTISATNAKLFDRQSIVNLNNEIPVVSSDLQRYIQTLYQNDIKLMQIQEAAATRNLQKQRTNILLNAGLGAGAGAMLGNPYTAAIGAGIGLVKGVVNYDFAVKDAADEATVREINFENKLINLKNNLIDIVGTDIDLKRKINLDKIQLWQTNLTNTDTKYINDFLFYHGYKTLEIKKPVMKTREKFDFKQIVWKELKCDYNLPVDVKNDILRRWADGVTIYHGLGSINNFYDFDQKYENREVSLL